MPPKKKAPAKKKAKARSSKSGWSTPKGYGNGAQANIGRSATRRPPAGPYDKWSGQEPKITAKVGASRYFPTRMPRMRKPGSSTSEKIVSTAKRMVRKVTKRTPAKKRKKK